MATIVFVDQHNGKITKSGLEAIHYATKMGGEVTALSYGQLTGDGGAGDAGASAIKVAENIAYADAQQLTRFISSEALASGAKLLVFSHDFNGKSIAPRVAVRLQAGLVTGVVELPDTTAGFSVVKNVFSGKAKAKVEITSDIKIISVLPNAFGLQHTGAEASVTKINADAGAAGVTLKSFVATDAAGTVPLPEAEIVVSAGRGLKGPENWGMIEELAKVLGATTACSRPVADIGWRPHHEHVGQTGIAIRPNLYIAIGISGAIQHLAGVNGSKVIVVINTDPEAPFFKAATYGIVGDAFEVVPKLIAALKS